jgi:hypothetical protein
MQCRFMDLTKLCDILFLHELHEALKMFSISLIKLGGMFHLVFHFELKCICFVFRSFGFT